MATAAMLPAIPKNFFRKSARKAATAWARGTNLEGRSKFGWGTAEQVAAMAPQFSHLSTRLKDAINALHKAEGQHLDYDGLKDSRIALESRFKSMDRATENVLNAKIGGSKVEWPADSNIPHGELDQLFDLLEKNAVYINKMENLEFERVGLDSPNNPDVSREAHPEYLSGTSRNPFNMPRNLARILLGGTGLKIGRRPGLTEANKFKMADAISNWIDGNASFDGQKVVWREGKARDWWNGEGGNHSVVLPGGIELNPDNITTQKQFDAWRIHEPIRLATALIDDHGSKLDAERQKLDDHHEIALKLPHLGEIVHNVSVIDMIRGLERKRRSLNAIKKLPDGFFAELEKLSNDIAMDVSALGNVATSSGDAHSEKTIAAAKELVSLLRMMESVIGKRQKGDIGSIIGDAMELIGRPQFDDVSSLSRGALDADAQLADYMNKMLIKYNWSSGIRQEGQALMASLASMDPKGIVNYLVSRTKVSPLAGWALGKAGVETPKVRQNTHVIPSRSDARLDAAMSKLRDQFRLQSKSTEQIEAATVAGFMATLRDRINSPSKPFAEYLDRMIGRDGAGELRAAFASGDFAGAFEIARPLIIRELDQKNGSGLASSKPTAMKAWTLARLGSRLVSTPLVVTGSILGAKDRYGAQASQHPLASKAAALAILGGGQLLSNAGLVASRGSSAAIALGTGSYLPAAWYAFRGENEEEQTAQGKLETIMHEAKKAGTGDVGAMGRLAAAGLFESVPLKMGSSADVLYGTRSNVAKQMGQAAGNAREPSVLDAAANFLPTTVGVGVMGADMATALSDYGLAGVMPNPLHPIPMFRTMAPLMPLVKDGMTINESPATPNVETAKPMAIVRTKANKAMTINLPTK